jgi:hypothetical protein
LIGIEDVLGIALVVVAGLLLLAFGIPGWKPRRFTLRSIPAFARLWKSISLTIEDGKRVHVTLGNSSLLKATNASALVGFSSLERIAQLSIASDSPPIATSGEGSLTILSQDSLRYIYRRANSLRQFDLSSGRMTGATPYSYVVGTMPVIYDGNVSTNILIGNYGPEIIYINEAAEHRGIYTLATSDSLSAQAVLYAAAVDPLIGEELFAIPAYMKFNRYHEASLHAQDVLRWILVAVLLGGVAYVLLQQLLGITFP